MHWDVFKYKAKCFGTSFPSSVQSMCRKQTCNDKMERKVCVQWPPSTQTKRKKEQSKPWNPPPPPPHLPAPLLWQRKFAEAGERRTKPMHLLEKSVINMIWLLLLVFDWPNIMISPCGLLLVLPTYSFSFMGGVAKK
jgi:hypothetical protein